MDLNIKKITALTLLSAMVVSLSYMYTEPTTVQSATASSNAIVTLNVDTGIAITSPGNTTMSTSLGVSANTAVGTTTWNVRTNNALGYTLTLRSSTYPAMQSGANYIDNYATSTMPTLWSVPASSAQFGFSVYGTDTTAGVWGTGTTCSAATSTPSTTLRYYGLGTVATTTAGRNATTTTSGVDTVVCYAVEQNGIYIPSGVYTATVTATATTI
jgi:hypothetical protein